MKLGAKEPHGLAALMLREIIDEAIRAALSEHAGNHTHAAKSLGISVRSLQRWLKKNPEETKK